jgi:hypothetical protein
MTTASRSQSDDRPETTSSPFQRRAGDELRPAQDLLEYAKCFARERPEVVAVWSFGIGFILGWKLKMW